MTREEKLKRAEEKQQKAALLQQEFIALIQEAKRLREQAKGRPLAEGWKMRNYGALTFTRPEQNGEYDVDVFEVVTSGLRILHTAAPALDGIAHDDKGRIKVVGYCNAEDIRLLMEESGYDMVGNSRLFEIIDELVG